VAADFHVGQEALRQGELVRANEGFKKVRTVDPDLVEARVNPAVVYHALGENNLAASDLSTALRQRPDLAGPPLILGIDYLKPGEAESRGAKAPPFRPW
jgi:Tfp pilus assembly protein PilF